MSLPMVQDLSFRSKNIAEHDNTTAQQKYNVTHVKFAH